MGLNITGPKKAAILMMSMGEEKAAEVLKLLDEKEIQQIGYFLSRMTEVNTDELDSILEEYYRKMGFKDDALFLRNGSEFISGALVRALGNEKASLITENIASGGETGALESLKYLDPRTICQFINSEHPQTIALILAHLEAPEQAAQVLKFLPENIQANVTYRMAVLESIPPSVTHEINEVLMREMDSAGTFSSSKVGGIEAVAEMLNTMEKSYESRILAVIEETNPELSEQIRELMFTFEDLVLIEKEGMQLLLSNVEQADITLALKSASDTVQQHILQNLSKRQGSMILDDLENMGPVKVSDVDAAQQKIIRVARKFEDDGQIIIGNRGGGSLI